MSSGVTRKSRKNRVLTAILLIAALVAIGVGILVFVILPTIFKNIPSYDLALEALSENTEAKTALGEPYEPGWFVIGGMRVSGSGGYADFTIPMTGAKANGTLFVESRKREGEWRLIYLSLKLDSAQRIIIVKD